VGLVKQKKQELFNKVKFIFEILLFITNIFLIIWFIVFSLNTHKEPISTTFINDLDSLNQDQLLEEKLRQDVLKIQLENKNLTSPWQRLSSFATITTIAVAVIGTFVTIWKQFIERQKDREQREAESRRRLDEKFSSLIKDLGAENKSLKVSAIVSMMTFLREEYSDYHKQVYSILLSNLKIEQDEECNRLLVQVFEKAVRMYLRKADKFGEKNHLDFKNTCLYGIDLEGLNLAYIDFAWTDLRYANLRKTDLFRAKGLDATLEDVSFTGARIREARLEWANLQNAHFHDAILHSSNLKKTNLKNAQFYRAELQSAHFERADLRGATFKQANLNDTYFFGAIFSDDTLKSILKARNWEKAHFDYGVHEELIEIYEKRKSA
jgi:uncharacterized protein YjbI with pentapeptide repeats